MLTRRSLFQLAAASALGWVIRPENTDGSIHADIPDVGMGAALNLSNPYSVNETHSPAGTE